MALYLAAFLLIGVITISVALKVASVFLIIAVMVRWEWRYLLLDSERASINRLATQIHATLFTRDQS
jgi:hypothetical protein